MSCARVNHQQHRACHDDNVSVTSVGRACACHRACIDAHTAVRMAASCRTHRRRAWSACDSVRACVRVGHRSIVSPPQQRSCAHGSPMEIVRQPPHHPTTTLAVRSTTMPRPYSTITSCQNAAHQQATLIHVVGVRRAPKFAQAGLPSGLVSSLIGRRTINADLSYGVIII